MSYNRLLNIVNETPRALFSFFFFIITNTAGQPPTDSHHQRVRPASWGQVPQSSSVYPELKKKKKKSSELINALEKKRSYPLYVAVHLPQPQQTARDSSHASNEHGYI